MAASDTHCLHPAQALQGQTPAERKSEAFDMTEAALQARAADNPIATAMSFEHTQKNVTSQLVGLDPTRKKTAHVADRPKGIFGRPICTNMVKENSKRGAQHCHAMTHGGITPALLGLIAGHPCLEAAALAALDTVVRAELPLHVHAIMIALQHLRIGKRRDAALTLEMPSTDAQWLDYVDSLFLTVGNRHSHEHQATCTTGKKGLRGCRMCAPWAHGVGNAATSIVQLEPLSKANPDPSVGLPFRCDFCYAPSATLDSDAGVSPFTLQRIPYVHVLIILSLQCD
jgi:hypothetical protein